MQLLSRLFFAAIVYVLSSGCSKEPTPQLLVGDWLWEGSSGGIAGIIIKPHPSERIVLRFSADSRFNVYHNDTLSYSGMFRLTKAQSIYSGKEELKIETVKTGYHLKTRPMPLIEGIVSRLSNTQLSIGNNMYDGFGSSYVRQ